MIVLVCNIYSEVNLMNKIISKAKELLPLIMLFFALVLIFVPLPIMLIQVLLVLDTAFSLCLFSASTMH